MLSGKEKEREKERFKAMHTALAHISEFFEDVVIVCSRPVDAWQSHPDQCIRWLQMGSEFAAEGMVKDLARAFDEGRFVPHWSPGEIEEIDPEEIEPEGGDEEEDDGEEEKTIKK